MYIQRGIHNIQHQITYSGSNFIFHDSQGFESGASGELEIVWNFIEKRSTSAELKDQLHAIWYLASYTSCQLVTSSTGIAYPWRVLVLFYPQNLSSLTKGLEKVRY